MTFEYNSTRFGRKKVLPEGIVCGIRQHLVASGYNSHWTTGDLMECLLNFRHTGSHGQEERLLINHLEPVFTYLCTMCRLWEEKESIDADNPPAAAPPAARPGGARAVGNLLGV